MPLRKSKNVQSQPAAEPTLAERLQAAYTRKTQAEGLIAAGASQLASAAGDLQQVADDAFAEAARLSEIGNRAVGARSTAEDTAAEVETTLGV